jgi:hypothetical protein
MRSPLALVSAAVIACSAAIVTPAALLGTSSAATEEHALRVATRTAATLRAQLRKERESHRRTIRRLRRAALARPSVSHALALGAAAYGLPRDRLERVAFCESRLDPGAGSGPYRGLFQFGSALWRATPFRAFSRTDPYAASFAAAWALSRGMARHWPVCGR